MKLLDDAADGCVIFVVGAIGGSVFYFVKGALRSSSRGCRLAGGVQAVVTNNPRVRRWSAWAGVFTTIALSAEDARAPVSLALAWGGANALFSVRKAAPDAIAEGLKGATYGGAVGIGLCQLVRFLD